ncbi:hypothetical protein E2F48_14025 [Arthrobacter crusticola]|uniref:SnoaL-like domain-containing protein n=1 Tax=Arthrobacter crusticola TaxID=2547960 RepID=A0A4R5TT14_9MICC|nr:hypothetical protein E2F48_14025 [Arthrobacter crusticola]
MSDDDPVARLLTIEEIHQLKARYCRLVDEKAWTDLEELFAPDAHIEIAGGPAEQTMRNASRTARNLSAGSRTSWGPCARSTRSMPRKSPF